MYHCRHTVAFKYGSWDDATTFCDEHCNSRQRSWIQLYGLRAQLFLFGDSPSHPADAALRLYKQQELAFAMDAVTKMEQYMYTVETTTTSGNTTTTTTSTYTAYEDLEIEDFATICSTTA